MPAILLLKRIGAPKGELIRLNVDHIISYSCSGSGSALVIKDAATKLFVEEDVSTLDEMLMKVGFDSVG